MLPFVKFYGFLTREYKIIDILLYFSIEFNTYYNYTPYIR